jgi:broad specificity phosphatase PhoE
MPPTFHCIRHAQSFHNLGGSNYNLLDPRLTPLDEQHRESTIHLILRPDQHLAHHGISARCILLRWSLAKHSRQAKQMQARSSLFRMRRRLRSRLRRGRTGPMIGREKQPELLKLSMQRWESQGF